MAEITRLDYPLVVGAGAAGWTVALSLPRAYLLGSSDLGSSWLAQDGIAAAVGADDSPMRHADDMVRASHGLAVEEAVEILTMGGPPAIERLASLGAAFDRDDDGRLLAGREEGHSAARIVHADGDATGAEVMRALTAAGSARDEVVVIERRAVDLVLAGGRVAGVVTVEGKRREVFLAPGVILATGGAGRLYQRTTNPPGVTGDGVAMAARIGARLADLEFFQFHPTALDAGKDPMPLLTGALRTEGAFLVDAHGRRFMERHHPAGDLAPRQVLARAIAWQVERGEGAYLDARGVINLSERFPTVAAHAQSVGLDPSHHLLPVSPAAHHMVGGIAIDSRGRSSVPGLWAVGECATTGAHGAARLPSNSLLDGLVFGARAAADVTENVVSPEGEVVAPFEAFDLPFVAGPTLEELRHVMWARVGLVRTEEGLHQGRQHLLERERVLRRTLSGRVAVELALFVIEAALARTETRGSHYRADHPEADPAQVTRRLIDPAPVELTGIP